QITPRIPWIRPGNVFREVCHTVPVRISCCSIRAVWIVGVKAILQFPGVRQAVCVCVLARCGCGCAGSWGCGAPVPGFLGITWMQAMQRIAPTIGAARPWGMIVVSEAKDRRSERMSEGERFSFIGEFASVEKR